MAIHVKSMTEFKEMISKGVTLVDFYADWCGPCKMVAPIIDQLSTEFAGRANVIKVNVDELQDVAGLFSVQSIPTIMIFKDGDEKGKVVGFRPKQVLQTGLEKALNLK